MLSNFRSYQMAVTLHKGCTTLKLPGYLRDQLLRASSSVALNLAEGSAKPTVRDRLRFYNIAFASLREVQSILELASLEGAASHVAADQLAGCLYRLTRGHPS